MAAPPAFAPLLTYARDNDVARITAALAEGAPVDGGNVIGQRAIHIAALHGHAEAVEALLAGGSHANVANERGETPLHFAAGAKKDPARVVAILLAAGADTQVTDAQGRYPYERAKGAAVREQLGGPSLALLEAAGDGDEHQVAALIAAGANLEATDAAGRSAVHAAVRPALRVLFERSSHLLRRRLFSHSTQVLSPSLPCMRALLAAGAAPHVEDAAGFAPLHRALEEAFPDAVAALLNAGVDPNCADPSGRFPLAIALEGGDSASAALLLEKGARPNVEVGIFGSALAFAASKGDAGMVARLAARGADVSACDASGLAPLHVAARGGRVSAIEALLAAGAAVDARTKAGATALHLAALNKRADCVRALKRGGADVGATNANGETPAAVAKSADVLAALNE